MKRVTRVINIELTEIETLPDEKIKELDSLADDFKAAMMGAFSLFDKCVVEIKDFIVDVEGEHE